MRCCSFSIWFVDRHTVYRQSTKTYSARRVLFHSIYRFNYMHIRKRKVQRHLLGLRGHQKAGRCGIHAAERRCDSGRCSACPDNRAQNFSLLDLVLMQTCHEFRLGNSEVIELKEGFKKESSSMQNVVRAIFLKYYVCFILYITPILYDIVITSATYPPTFRLLRAYKF